MLARAHRHSFFRSLVLILFEYDQKIKMQRFTSAVARAIWLAHLRSRFDILKKIMLEAFVNYAFKYVLFVKAHTLIWKIFCLRAWIANFHDLIARGIRVAITCYSFLLLRDERSCLIELLPFNSLRENDGLAYYKAYNLSKNLFVNSLDVLLFAHSWFETLIFSAAKLKQWYNINR